jgi:hypothetical protein
MTFWPNTLSNVLGGIGAGVFFLLCYLMIQWFLRATDLVIGYSWRWEVRDGVVVFWPAFDIRNRAHSKKYRLANIAYTVKGTPHWFDNKGIMGVVIEPESMNFIDGLPVANVRNLAEATHLEVTIRDQSKRSFWLRGEGPGQQGKGWTRRNAFKLRALLEKWLIAME